jgi:hypothetical protein
MSHNLETTLTTARLLGRKENSSSQFSEKQNFIVLIFKQHCNIQI